MNKKKKLNRTNLRAWVLLGVIVGIGFLSVVAELFQLQIVDGATYKARALQQRTRSQVLEPKRGTIYDRNEKVLAQSAPVWNICISPAEINPEQLPDIAKNLGEILDVPVELILTLAEDKKSLYEVVKRKVDNQVREEVENYIKSGEERIRGIFPEESVKRYYTFDSLASTLIGFTTDHDNRGAYGMEAYYDSILSGTPGVNVSSRDSKNLDMSRGGQYHDAEDGYSIVLTIDETLQSILEKHLEMAIVEHSVENKATGIVMNMKTGEILAMATKPDFNPNSPYDITDEKALALLEGLEVGSDEYKTTSKDLLYEQWRNKAISDPYEPGSVYKILTASMALEENKSFLNDEFFCSGSIKVADRTMNCWLNHGHGKQDFEGIVRNSCNPAFVTLGLRIGGKTTHQYMTDFGLGKITGIDLPGEAEGILHSESKLSNGVVQLASSSFGQSFKTTPIQLITAVSAAVNGGDLVQPYVVKQIMDEQGNVVETIQPNIKRQVISKATSDKIKGLVEAVVTNGSGSHAAVPGYRIGGKTGTSEKLDMLPQKKYVLSFVGFAPMEDPTYACLVVLDEPKLANYWASVIAAPVVGAIFQESLPYLGVEPHFTAEELAKEPVAVPYLINKKPHDAQAELTALGLKTKIVGQGSNVIRQIPLNGNFMQKGSLVTLYTQEDMLNPNLTVPDLTDMTTEQAKQTLMDMGLNFQMKGTTDSRIQTIVKEQWPLAGETIATADVVTITVVRADTGEIIAPSPEIPYTPPEDEPEYEEEDFQDTNLEPEDVAPPPPEPESKEPEFEPPEPVRGPTGEVIDS